jgi:hypothetical protein
MPRQLGRKPRAHRPGLLRSEVFVIRSLRPVAALLAVSALLAAACGGSAATAVPTPTPSPTPIRDPEELIARSLYEILRVESLHVRADFNGRASLSILGGGGSILGALGASIDLGGSYLEGDVDVERRAADVAFEVPGFPTGLNGRVIVAAGSVYTRISIQGDRFSKAPLGDALAGIETAAPSGSATTGRTDALRRSLQEAGLVAEMLPMEPIDGRSCYHVSAVIPPARLNAALSQAGGYAARITVESATLEYWAFEDTLLPARLELTAEAGSMGNLQAEVVFSRYGEPVAIEPPDPSQVG